MRTRRRKWEDRFAGGFFMERLVTEERKKVVLYSLYALYAHRVSVSMCVCERGNVYGQERCPWLASWPTRSGPFLQHLNRERRFENEFWVWIVERPKKLSLFFNFHPLLVALLIISLPPFLCPSLHGLCLWLSPQNVIQNGKLSVPLLPGLYTPFLLFQPPGNKRDAVSYLRFPLFLPEIENCVKNISSFLRFLFDVQKIFSLLEITFCGHEHDSCPPLLKTFSELLPVNCLHVCDILSFHWRMVGMVGNHGSWTNLDDPLPLILSFIHPFACHTFTFPLSSFLEFHFMSMSIIRFTMAHKQMEKRENYWFNGCIQMQSSWRKVNKGQQLLIDTENVHWFVNNSQSYTFSSLVIHRILDFCSHWFLLEKCKNSFQMDRKEEEEVENVEQREEWLKNERFKFNEKRWVLRYSFSIFYYLSFTLFSSLDPCPCL